MPTRLRDFATAVVAVVEPETTALTVAQLMRQHHIGALVVVDAQEKTRPVGIVTDRDLVLSLMAVGLDPTLFTAGDIMSIELVVANVNLDAMDAVQLMRTQRVRRLVLVDDQGGLAGIVTMEDVLELLTREMANLAAGVIGARDRGIGNPTTRAQISSLQPPSKPAFCLRRHDHWADHWASPGPDAALTRPFGATGSATSTARPTARSRRRSVCPLTNRCVDRARHRVLPGLTRPSPGRLGPPARHHLHPARHTRPKAAARAPGRWAAPGRPHRCAPGSA